MTTSLWRICEALVPDLPESLLSWPLKRFDSTIPSKELLS